jgi:hypothetical protein
MAKQQLSDLDFNSSSKILNLPDPTSAQHAATKAYVDANVEGLAWKDSVRAASTGNINLSSPGSTIDGISMTSGDRFLAKDQTTGHQNGIYIWNGSATPATRSLDMNSAPEVEAAVVTVEEGTTNAGTTWRQTAVNVTLDTTTLTFTSFGTTVPSATETVEGKAEIATQTETDTGTDDARIVTPLKLKNSKWANKSHQANIGDGSATQYDVTHSFGTRDVIVSVYRNSGNYDDVLCDVSRPDTNTVRLNFAAAPSSNQFRVVITRATNA